MPTRSQGQNIEVFGQSVRSVTDGFRHFKTLAKKFLLREGIGREENGELVIDNERWYPQEPYLRAFHAIGREVGDAVLFDIGLAIPRNAKFPPWIVDVESALRSIDTAYHMNHRKNGEDMFNPQTGKMLEGIGHYGYEKIEKRDMIVSVCDNPYPCYFDRGVITSMARRFDPTAVVMHNDALPCRKNGAENCSYIVTWRGDHR